MSIDVGEGLRGIQPVTEVLRADVGYQRDPSAAQFKDNLQEYLKERQQNRPKGEDILKKIKYNYDKLYNKYGVQPNAVMISPDYLAIIEAECSAEYRVTLGVALNSVLGLDVILVNGKEIIKACIIDKED